MKKHLESIISSHKTLVFILIFLSVLFFLDYHHILFYFPRGVHFIRQTDSLSFVANYYYFGMNFFEPALYDVTSISGRGASEFPFLYYLTAFLYRLFGEHEYFLRLLNLSILTAGFIGLFKMLSQLLEDFFLSVCLTLLIFSSPVLLYYSNNFIPDAPALGFILLGWSFFFKYQKDIKSSSILYSFLFFTLSSLLRSSYLINVCTLLAVFILEIIGVKFSGAVIFKNRKLFYLGFFFSLLVVALWNVFVQIYNAQNNNFYFLTHPRPIWGITLEEVNNNWKFISSYWFPNYYYRYTFYFIALIFIINAIKVRKLNKLLLFISGILTIGGIAYIILFYQMFHDHDYCFIVLYPIGLFYILISFLLLKSEYITIFKSGFLKSFLLLLTLASIRYGSIKLKERYTDNEKDTIGKIAYQLNGAKNHLDSTGIPKNAIFVVVADYSPNGGLYFMNRKGWAFNEADFYQKDIYANLLNWGADYILFTNPIYKENPLVKDYIGEYVGTYHSAYIYKLKQKS